MTEQELATQIFPASRSTSISSASVITAVAAADSSDGSVSVTIDGAQVGGANTKIVVPTTLSVAAGETVLLTLYGEDGHGKKAYVSGKVGESGGGGDPTLPGRVSTLESEMDAVQSDVAAEKTKINELVTLANSRGFERLYYWTAGGQSRTGIWYQKASGLCFLSQYVDGYWAAGNTYFNSSSPLPQDLRPGNFGGMVADVHGMVRAAGNSMMFLVQSNGLIGAQAQVAGNKYDSGTLVWLAKADLNYTSTISTVDSSISPLTVTRAYAARVALGDGLDVTSDEFERTAPIYDEAYDVIFGDDTSEER